MSGADTSLDGAFARLAAFRSRYGIGVVAQLVEHHNGIVHQVVRNHRRVPQNAMFFSGLLPAIQASPKAIPSLADAVADLLRAKDASRRRPQYVRSLRQYLTAFARGRETVSVADLTAEHLDEWFAERNEAPATRASNLGRLSALFSFSVRRGWISTNPVLRVERITIDHAPPKIWSAAQCRAVLDASSPVIRAWVTLGLFAGLRPTEAERLDWSAVRLDGAEPCVVISAEASKVRRRRIVPLCETAWAWLSLDWRREGPVVSSHSTLRRARRETAERAGVKWSADVLRHSYASFRIGRGDFAERVAADMGNSSRILLTHYRELVSREEASAFWALRPSGIHPTADRGDCPNSADPHAMPTFRKI